MCKEVNEKTKEKKFKIGVVSAVGSIIAFFLINYGNISKFSADIYEKCFAPDLIFEEQEDYVEFSCEFQPKDAQLVLSPQLVIRQEDDIIRILSFDDVCKNRTLQYNKEEGSFFCDNMRWDDALEFARRIKEELKHRGYDVSIHKAYLLKMTYMKTKDYNQHETYYIAEEGLATTTNKKVIEKRGRAKKLIGTDWEDAFDEIISECIEALNDI